MDIATTARAKLLKCNFFFVSYRHEQVSVSAGRYRSRQTQLSPARLGQIGPGGISQKVFISKNDEALRQSIGLYRGDGSPCLCVLRRSQTNYHGPSSQADFSAVRVGAIQRRPQFLGLNPPSPPLSAISAVSLLLHKFLYQELGWVEKLVFRLPSMLLTYTLKTIRWVEADLATLRATYSVRREKTKPHSEAQHGYYYSISLWRATPPGQQSHDNYLVNVRYSRDSGLPTQGAHSELSQPMPATHRASADNKSPSALIKHIHLLLLAYTYEKPVHYR